MRFEEMLEPCRRELLAYCRHLLWNKNDLHDALQEIVLQAWRAFPRFTEGNFKAWLFQVATYTVYNLNRKHRDYVATVSAAEPDVEGELVLEDRYETILKDPDRILEALDRDLRESVRQLNENEKTILLLRSLCDMKYHEIASTLSVPIGTVMGTLARARAKVRRMLSEKVHAL